MTMRTLYRLTGVTPDLDGLLDALPIEILDELRFTPTFPDTFPGVAALLISGQFDISHAPWTSELLRLTGIDLDLKKLDSAALLLLAVDGEVYAIGFGQGFRLVPDEYKDPSFGLRVAVRSIDPDLVHDVVRRSMTGQGRQDATLAPSGLPIGRIGIRQHTELVRRLGGLLSPSDLGLTSRRSVKIEGSAGLRLPLPTDPLELLTCIRSLSKICAADPQPGLAFIEAIQPVSDDKTRSDLDSLLDEVLLGRAEAPLSLAVPVSLSSNFHNTGSYTIRIGSASIRGRDNLNLDDLLYRLRVQHPATPTEALRSGWIEMYDTGGELLGKAPANKWIESCLVRGSRHYFLIEGDWYEGGADYLASIRRQVVELLDKPPSITLPPWRKGEHERAYNLRAQQELGRPRFLCLDRTSVRTALHRPNGIEVCDGYGEHGELICIKPAAGSPPLSHQFNQALIAVETLLHDADARHSFNQLVTDASGGTRHVSSGARPEKVIFGIHLKNGRELTPDTLFPFAQIALINMAVTLRQDVEVEVIGIPAE
jgi:uncharacterized protein (TIGR04141 family)